jgi:hypothetical protein
MGIPILQIQPTSVLNDIRYQGVNSGQKVSAFEIPHWNFKQKVRKLRDLFEITNCDFNLQCKVKKNQMRMGMMT